MKKKHIQILVFLIFAILFSSIKIAAQTTDNKVTVTSVVKDEQGNPIAGATIYGNEGAITARTDASGRFTISVPDMSDLLIEADGHEPAVYRSGEFKNMKEFSLKVSPFMYGARDDVYVAMRKIKKGDVANAITVIDPEEILRYDNDMDILDALRGRVPGLLGSSNMRGIGTPLFIVDGMPRDISNINLAEVEQIAVLKDINSAVLYGNGALNGVIQITTKRGEARKRQVKVSGWYGISKPKALPEYLPSADYETLYNEALVNNGLLKLYDDATIANYRSGDSYRYPSVDYYSREYLKSIKPYSKVMTELTGGGDVAKYYANLGWDNSGSLIGFGAGENGGMNRFNARGNVDLRINNWITSALDAVAVFNDIKSPISDYWSSASTLRPNLYTPLLPISYIANQEDQLLKARKNDIDGLFLLGGTQAQKTNPIGDTYSGGYNDNIQRIFSFNNRVDFNLGQVLKGLAFHTNISFDFYNRFNQSINNTYAVYEPTWNSSDKISALSKYGIDTREGSQNITSPYYERRFGFYGMLDYDRTFGDHHFNGALNAYGNRYKRMQDPQGTKDADLAVRLGWGFKNKYLVNFSGVVINSVKLAPGNKTAFSPSLAAAWVVSSEDFMSSMTAVNYLKLRASAGIINSDANIGGFYYYDYRYGTSTSARWYESTTRSSVIPTYGGNFNLFFEKRKELNFGLEGLLFNRTIGVDANVFFSSYSDIVTRPYSKYPSFYSQYVPYENFGENAYRGAEIGLTYNKTVGDLSFTVGVNALYTNSEVKKRDEIYADAYQNRTGKPVDAMFGLVADGFFANDAEITAHERQVFGTVKPGDLKYIDQNGDKVIDSNDEIQIGRWQAPFSYGLTLKVDYKNLTFFAIGTGRIGADNYQSGNYYWVDGSDKYSTVVLNRWTPATAATATYPRLSSQANPNDFRSSTFWIYRDNYFTLDRMQITYEMPVTVAQMLRMKKLSFFVNGSDIFMISKHKDIRELNVGTEPQYRSYSVGIKTVF